MSILDSMRELIQCCPYIDEFAGFYVDYTAAGSEGYGVYPTGETKETEYMDGSSTWKYEFVLQASLFTANDMMRIQNCNFVEMFQKWLDGFSRTGVDLGENNEFLSISAGNGILSEWDDDEQRGTYQIQCILRYERVV